MMIWPELAICCMRASSPDMRSWVRMWSCLKEICYDRRQRLTWDGQQALLPHLMPIEAKEVQSGIERSRAGVSKHDTWAHSHLLSKGICVHEKACPPSPIQPVEAFFMSGCWGRLSS